MISVFGPSMMIAAVFCTLGWAYLTYRNLLDGRGWFFVACLTAALGYALACAQYIEIFYIQKLQQSDFAMWLLYLRMTLHSTTVLIFIYVYRFKLRKKP